MKVLITGAGGFLGSAIAKKLLTRGDSVRGIARASYPPLSQLGVEMLQGDISDYAAVREAVRDCDAVIHVAAKAGVWGSYQSYYQPNVIGTENVIRACREQGIKRLVYTSSPSVVFDGKDENGVDESAPYAKKHLCFYSETKATAEKQILAANSAELMTVALRPHLMWGPGDPHLLPRIINRARVGRMRIIGWQDKLIDTVYVDNAADAHILALDKLQPDAAIAGKTYFISNDQPMLLVDIVNKMLDSAAIAPLKKRVPIGFAFGVATLLEFVYTALKIEQEPLLTRFLVRQLSAAHWFNISAAKRDLGYQPQISIDQGIEILRQSFDGTF